jgi:hypothetical protein
MITIKTFASIAAILLPLGSCAAYAQTAPNTPGTAGPTTASPPVITAPPGATKTPDGGMAKLQAACKTDIEKFCGDSGKTAQKAPAGQSATKAPEQLVACMTTNEAKLTATCKTAWTEQKATTKGNPG